jgi:hypothetical protein
MAFVHVASSDRLAHGVRLFVVINWCGLMPVQNLGYVPPAVDHPSGSNPAKFAEYDAPV